MLSVVITTWNESENLPRVVASVGQLADEIIVVDTESTDDTVSVAKKLGCQVYTHPNTGIVEPVRNFSINKAKGDWILLLDADEEISPSLSQEIKEIIKQDKAEYIRIPRQNYIFGKWIKSTHWWPDYVYRLFKKDAVTWSPEIHSIPMTKGRGMDLPQNEKTSIIHHHYTSISQFISRLDRYTTIQAAEHKKKNSQFHWSDVITRPSAEFLTQYFARNGYKDGLHGLSLSLLQACSELVLSLKIWQSSGFHPNNLSLQDVKTQFTKSAQDFKWWNAQKELEIESNIIKKFIIKIKKHI